MNQMVTSDQLGVVRKLGYGVGDFGFGLFFLTASQYLLFYYTDVLGLTPSTAGWVFGLALVWDAVFDPVMGGVANRTRTRWGRYRPYVLFGSVPLALSWALIFLPTGLVGWPLVLFAGGAHILFRTLYAVAYMPYLALSAAMTTDTNQRSSLAAYRMVGQAGAGVLAGLSTLSFAARLGGGQLGFFRLALIFGGAAVLLCVIVYLTSRERAAVPGDRPSFAAMWRMLRGNGPFWLVCGALLIGYVAGVFFNKSIPYYVKYGLGRPDLIQKSLGLLALTVTLSIPIWAAIMRRNSKRGVFLAGSGIAMLAYALLWLLPSVSFWIPLLALLGLGTGGVYLATWAMLPDTVEYGEWRSGVRAEGALFGFVSLGQKTSLGLAAVALGQALGAIGYHANVAQSAGTLADLRLIMIGVPALFTAAMAGIIWFYPLNADRHRELVREIGQRRSAHDALGEGPTD
ncbi:MAG: MFS transporter [Sphingomonadaceae bacterium]|nr:MFS transporter [Sphingomonadaceae bacterium]